MTLNEGSTPLIDAPRLSERIGARGLLEVRGREPDRQLQGPRDDRRRLARQGAWGGGVICASTGNTAASCRRLRGTRRAARGGDRARRARSPSASSAQALMHGARVIALQGNFDDALRIVRELAQKHPIELVNSVNPYRIEGQKTAAFEVVRRAGRGARRRWRSRSATPATSPPTGAASRRGGRCAVALRLPGRGRRAAGARRPGREPRDRAPPRSGSATRPAGRRRWPPSPPHAGGSRRSPTSRSSTPTAGWPRREGVFCEPASAASVAGLLAHGLPVVEGSDPPESVVCVLTGHGLKDPDTALGKAPAVVNCENDLSAVERAVFD